MFRADLLMMQLIRIPQSVSKDVRAFLREWNVQIRGRLLWNSQTRHNFRSDVFNRIGTRKKPARESSVFPKKPEQQILGFDSLSA